LEFIVVLRQVQFMTADMSYCGRTCVSSRHYAEQYEQQSCSAHHTGLSFWPLRNLLYN